MPYKVTRTLKVVTPVTGELVEALDKNGHPIPIAGYWWGPGRASVLSRRYRTTPGWVGPLPDPNSHGEIRRAQAMMRKLQKKAMKPRAVMMRKIRALKAA